MTLAFTARRHGDQRRPAEGRAPSPVPAGLALRRPRQVHGADVVVVGGPPPPGAGAFGDGVGAAPEADAVVARDPGFALAVLTADCVPVGLGSPEGLYAAVHVGWRGLRAGVLGRALGVLADMGASAVVAGIGPCIGSCCYEFGPEQLEDLARMVPAAVGPRTREGRPALDVRAGVRSQLAAAGATVAVDVGDCTSCTPGYFSHRRSGDAGRQALYVWRSA